MFKAKSYSYEIDLWSLGILAFWIFAGDYPVIKKRGPIYPSEFPNDLIDLIDKLLVEIPEKRLGCGKEGFKELKNHQFFTDIKWEEFFTNYFKTLKKLIKTKLLKFRRSEL